MASRRRSLLAGWCEGSSGFRSLALDGQLFEVVLAGTHPLRNYSGFAGLPFLRFRSH